MSHYHHQSGLPTQVSLLDYGVVRVEVLAIVMLKSQQFVNQILELAAHSSVVGIEVLVRSITTGESP